MIDIVDGERLKCPHCKMVFAVENETEILFRNVRVVHFKISEGHAKTKCRECKTMIELKISEIKGKRLVL